MSQTIRKSIRGHRTQREVDQPKVTLPEPIKHAGTEIPGDREYDPEDDQDFEKWKKENNDRKNAVWFTSPEALTSANIAPSAKIEGGTIIGDNVMVGPNTEVTGGSTLDDNASIGEKSRIISSEIGRSATIGQYSIVKDARIGEHVHSDGNLTINRGLIGKSAVLRPFVTLSFGAEVPDESRIPINTTVTAPTTNVYTPHGNR